MATCSTTSTGMCQTVLILMSARLEVWGIRVRESVWKTEREMINKWRVCGQRERERERERRQREVAEIFLFTQSGAAELKERKSMALLNSGLTKSQNLERDRDSERGKTEIRSIWRSCYRQESLFTQTVIRSDKVTGSHSFWMRVADLMRYERELIQQMLYGYWGVARHFLKCSEWLLGCCQVASKVVLLGNSGWCCVFLGGAL